MSLPASTPARVREVEIAAGALDAIRAEAERSRPEECCGFLMGRDEGGVRRVAGTRPAPNGAAAVERRRAYALASSDYLACERAARAAGLDIVGFYHSHPEGPALPSAADERDAWPWYVYAIVSGDSVTCWLLAEDRGAFEKLTLRRAPPP